MPQVCSFKKFTRTYNATKQDADLDDKSKILQVTDFNQVPGHSMYKDWALPDRPYSYLPFKELVPALYPGRSPQMIEFSQICAKPNHWFGTDDFQGERFDQADPQFPGMLVQGMPNPCELPFRMIDGRRRLEKLKQNGDVSGLFMVLKFEEVQPYILDFELID